VLFGCIGWVFICNICLVSLDVMIASRRRRYATTDKTDNMQDEDEYYV